MRYRLFGALAASALALASPAAAHHPSASSAGTAGPITTISATTLDPGQSVVSFAFEYSLIRSLSDATLLNAATLDQHVHSLRSVQSLSLGYSYGLAKDLTLSARLPFVRRTDIREGHQHDPLDPPEIHDRGDVSGIGDLSLLAQWRFLNSVDKGTEMALLAGFKAPTGRTNATDKQGETFDAEFQPGTGAWDGMFGFALSQRLSGGFGLHSNVLYIVTGEGVLETRLGDRFLYNLALAYRLFGDTAVPMTQPPPHSHSHSHSPTEPHSVPHRHQQQPALDVILELNGEWHGKQVEQGIKDVNSGGNVVLLAPGFRLTLDNWSAFASVGVPIVNNLNGIQAESGPRIQAGFAISF